MGFIFRYTSLCAKLRVGPDVCSLPPASKSLFFLFILLYNNLTTILFVSDFESRLYIFLKDIFSNQIEKKNVRIVTYKRKKPQAVPFIFAPIRCGGKFCIS